MMKQPPISTLNPKNTVDTNDMEYLHIHGASCASCVGKIESALNQIAGVEQALMNLAQSTVAVSGHAPVEDLIAAVKQAGYDAENITDNSDQNILDEKEKADAAYYKRLMRDMWTQNIVRVLEPPSCLVSGLV